MAHVIRIAVASLLAVAALVGVSTTTHGSETTGTAVLTRDTHIPNALNLTYAFTDPGIQAATSWVGVQLNAGQMISQIPSGCQIFNPDPSTNPYKTFWCHVGASGTIGPIVTRGLYPQNPGGAAFAANAGFVGPGTVFGFINIVGPDDTSPPPCTGSMSASTPSNTGNPSCPASLVITDDNGKDVTNKSTSKVVGQHIVLHVASSSGDVVTNIHWLIPGSDARAPDDTVVKSYPMPASDIPMFKHMQPLYLQTADLQKTDVEFYWVKAMQGGAVTVSVKGTIAGKVSGASTQYTVNAPSSTMQSKTSQVGIGFPAPGVKGTPWLSFGDNLASGYPLAGISFTFTAQSPQGGAGQIAATQLISDSILHNDTPCSGGTSGAGYWLDNAIHYPVPFPANAVIPIGDSSAATWKSSDSPTLPLARPTTYTRIMNFRMFFMYRPDGKDSIWVTLGRLKWKFSGAAAQIDEKANLWTLTKGSASNSVNPSGEASSLLPTWNHVYKNANPGC